MKRSVSRVLALFVLASTISLPLANAQNGASSAATDKLSQKKETNALKWKKQILKVPVGSYMKAKLESHDEFEGQLRDISDSGFSIQSSQRQQDRDHRDSVRGSEIPERIRTVEQRRKNRQRYRQDPDHPGPLDPHTSKYDFGFSDRSPFPVTRSR